MKTLSRTIMVLALASALAACSSTAPSKQEVSAKLVMAEVPSWFQYDPASLLYQSWAEVEGDVPEAVHKKPVEPVTEAAVLEEVVRVH